MDKLSLFILPHKSVDHPLISQVRQKLNAAGLECCDQHDQDFKCVLILWPDKLSPEGIMQEVAEYHSKDFKVILLNIGNTVPDNIKWQLIRAGARDCIDWKDGNEIPELLMSKIKRWKAVEELVKAEATKHQMIGDSLGWRRFLRKVVEAAHFTNNNILLTGESGTGKELTARMVHSLDRRKEKGELVLLDCTTIVPELSGSEFYGHEKGAFTHATYTREGAFALADKGSLFLDELGDLPIQMQSGLLRVIQEKMYKRVGGNTWKHIDFRLVCATNKNMQEEIKRGNFREDLYYRIATAVFTLPTLRERREDIPELVRYFLRQELNTVAAPEIDKSVMNYLIYRDYPGNIRELRQLISRIAMRYTGEGMITIGDVPEDELPAMMELHLPYDSSVQSIQQSIRLAIASGKDLLKIKNEFARLAMEIALEDCSGNLKLAARRLNVEVRTLQYLRKKIDTV